MNVKTIILVGFALLLLFLGMAEQSYAQFWEMPAALPPDEFGNLLINRTSERKGVKPAVFSHWEHRRKFTCRVCHFELEFNMQVNTTEITDAAIRAGKYCGANGCHDNKASFGNEKPHCEKCHNGNIGYGREKFSELSKLPKAKFGNRIEWVQAINSGSIAPVNYLTIKPPEEVAIVKNLVLEAEWAGIPPAVFSHKAHASWLDCNNCHPDIFNLKKKTTKHFSMERILKREFCGVCHLTVAFPMNDCKGCHPAIK
jgi:c(7)-type cytochrome triheme protein